MPRRQLHTRPDRLDFRDRLYLPPLKALPNAAPDLREFAPFWDWYVGEGNMVSDQDTSPSCTGHALAAVINYRACETLWEDAGNRPPELSGHERPSADMLYALARLYDEFEGEDHNGSSCRGAMKGWHQHGVLDQGGWTSLLSEGPVAARRVIEQRGISQAVRRPGAYYRVKVTDVDDVRAAILEARAVFASVRVHNGWVALENWTSEHDPRRLDRLALNDRPWIAYPEPRDQLDGGHAVCLVGYDADGFLVQNSWGPRWGFKGLAWLSYADWYDNAMDAWVAVEGAPINAKRGINDAPDLKMIVRSSATSNIAGTVAIANPDKVEASGALGQAEQQASQWPPARAASQMLCLGTDGRAVLRRLDLASALSTSKTRETELSHRQILHLERSKADQAVRTALACDASEGSDDTQDLALIFGNGFDGEQLAQAAFALLGARFEQAGVKSLYVDWLEALWPVLTDRVIDWSERALDAAPRTKSAAWWESYTNDYAASLDRLMEAAARKLLGPALWFERKATARLATEQTGAINCLAHACNAARDGGARLHVVAHSTGAILACHFIMATARLGLPICSVNLVAPACDFATAASAFGFAFRAKVVRPETLYLQVLPTEIENTTRDMPPYTKSALYFVSTALEARPRTALLGMEAAWWPEKNQGADRFDVEDNARFLDWLALWPPAAAAARQRARTDKLRALQPNLQLIPGKTLNCNGIPRAMSHRHLMQDKDIVQAVLRNIRAG